MARVSIYLNFSGTAEEAFNFYKSVFNTESDQPMVRMGEMPEAPGMPPISEKEKNKIMHLSLPILDGTRIMATDMLESMGHKVQTGNNININLEPDSREEVDRLFAALSENGSEIMKPQEMPWGYFGACVDQYDIRWMFNFGEQS